MAREGSQSVVDAACRTCGRTYKTDAVGLRDDDRCAACTVASMMPAEAPTSAPERRRVPPVQPAVPTVPATPRATVLWEADRPGFREARLTVDELRELVRIGDLRAADLIRPMGGPTWTKASDLADLATAFALRRRDLSQRLGALARKERHRCQNHPARRAERLCAECVKTYCDECDGGSRGARACPSCSAATRPL